MNSYQGLEDEINSIDGKEALESLFVSVENELKVLDPGENQVKLELAIDHINDAKEAIQLVQSGTYIIGNAKYVAIDASMKASINQSLREMAQIQLFKVHGKVTHTLTSASVCEKAIEILQLLTR